MPKVHEFTCTRCGQTKTYESDFSTGYGIDPRGNIICYVCCADVDRKQMEQAGEITLYLVYTGDGRYLIQNWPGTLVFPVTSIKKGRHNLAKYRYDVRFRVDGKLWAGVQYGEQSQLVHCRRLKEET